MTYHWRERRGRDRVVVGCITTYVISPYHHLRRAFESRPGEVYSIQHYFIKFVCHLRQVDGFLHVLLFPPPIKLSHDITEILFKETLSTLS